MPKTSSIKLLPQELQDQIHELLDRGRTLEEIRDALSRLGAEISRSALGRYKQKLDKVGEKIRRSREVADALVRNLGDAPESKTTRMNVELMHSVVLDMLLAVGEPGEAGDGEAGQPLTLDPMQTMLMAKALDHLARASKTDTETITKIREQATAAAKKQAAEAVGTVGRERGLSKDTVEEIKARILGVRGAR